jgi:hypothetical protein
MKCNPSWEADSYLVGQKLIFFYGTRMFITVFTRARHCPLSWATWIQSTRSHVIYLRTISILSSHPRLVLQSDLFPSVLPTTKFYAFLVSVMPATCSNNRPHILKIVCLQFRVSWRGFQTELPIHLTSPIVQRAAFWHWCYFQYVT